MKNLIEYYYSLEVSNLRKYGNDYVFNYNNRMFIFYSIKENMNIDFSYNLYKNHMNNGIFHSFIFNIDKKLLTFDGSRDRVLLLINIKYNKKLDLADILYFANTNMLQSYNFKPNWGDLWTSKVDFLEYYLGKNDNINDKVKILCYYYIGMAENAIMYFNNIDLANKKIENNVFENNIGNLSGVNKVPTIGDDPFFNFKRTRSKYKRNCAIFWVVFAVVVVVILLLMMEFRK